MLLLNLLFYNFFLSEIKYNPEVFSEIFIVSKIDFLFSFFLSFSNRNTLWGVLFITVCVFLSLAASQAWPTEFPWELGVCISSAPLSPSMPSTMSCQDKSGQTPRKRVTSCPPFYNVPTPLTTRSYVCSWYHWLKQAAWTSHTDPFGLLNPSLMLHSRKKIILFLKVGLGMF